MISNVLAVHNEKNKVVKFFVDLSVPSEWKAVTKKQKLYEVNPGDSIFIPIHILPKINLRGSTRFLFTAYVYDENNEPYGFTYFYGIIKKNISWNLTTPEKKIYLPNGSSSIPFNISLMNNGYEEQDIHLSLISLSKSTGIYDSSGTSQAAVPVTFKLQSLRDTSFYFTFLKLTKPRNYRLIDIEGYNPYSTGDEKKYYVTVNSTAPNPADYNKFRAGEKIHFIQLSDIREVNRYATDVIPLEVDMNAYNILGNSPMMNINLRGQAYITEKSTLLYNSQLTYTSNFFTTNPYEYATIYLGYFHNKFNVQFGNMTSGVLGTFQNGQGLKAEYYIDQKQRVGAFYTSNPRLFNSNPLYTSFGVSHNYETKLFRVNTQLGHSIDNIRDRFSDVINVNASTNFIKNHSFGIRAGVSRNVEKDSAVIDYGYMAGVYYSGRYLHKKMFTHISASYISPRYGILNHERLTVNAGNEYKINEKWNVFLRNNLYRYPSPNLSNNPVFDFYLNNQANFNRINSKAGNFSPFLFYNLSRIENFRVHGRGAGINIGKYNLIDNHRYFLNLRAGYNRALDTLKKDFFFLQLAGFVQVRTWSFMTRYNLGNFSVSRSYFLYNSIKNPQNISLTLRHQYVFSFTPLVMSNSAGFSYSTLSGRNINFNPELYYFARKGWRFRLFAEINFSIGAFNRSIETYYTPATQDEGSDPEWSRGFYLGVGVRKEFGIPVPKTRKKYATVEFIAFYDVNGNGMHDKTEDVLENVVIRVDAWEVLTNKDGQASMLNVPVNAYLFSTFSITDLKGWFPHINDTLYLTKSCKVYVPFARGIKVTGKVFLDREKIAADSDKPFDMSRIKISMVNQRTYTTLTSFDGSFELYVPMGSYILTMDEKVLGEKFQLLQNNFELHIDEKFDNLFVPFYVFEKKRKVKVIKFDRFGNRIDE